MKIFSVKQSGNRVEVFGTSEPIFYEVQGIDLPPLTDYSFAVWHILPHAMKHGYGIHIDGPVDPMTIENAIRYSRTWEMWQPSYFREVTVTSSEEAQPIEDLDSDLTLFSGGIDATYMLLELGKRMPKAVALTIHGMEYKVENEEGFQGLLHQTSPLLSALNYRRITLKSNATHIVRGTHRWGPTLAGSASLFSGLFGSANHAADYSWEQDMIAFPLGLNHITNRYLRGTNFALSSLTQHVTRAEKVEAITSNATALHSVSFCHDWDIRPKNCGRCEKCLRTKAIFMGMTGHIPAIFIDNSFTAKSIDALFYGKKYERPFFIDLYQRAKGRGTLNLLPGMERRMNQLRRRPGIKGWLSRVKNKLQ